MGIPTMLLLALVLLLGATVIRLALTRRSKDASSPVLDVAARYEQEGRFEDACYHYGVAAMNGARERCEPRVRSLWRAHGPFGFADLAEQMRHSYCSRFESCGQGYHHIVVQEIARIVGDTSKT